MKQDWIKLKFQSPNVVDNGNKVLVYRTMNISQESMSMSIYETSMVKYCDPEETWWTNLPNPPKTDKL